MFIQLLYNKSNAHFESFIHLNKFKAGLNQA